MNENSENQMVTATVVEIIDGYKVVINKGSIHGIFLNQNFLVYSLSQEEIIDPETNEKLGKLEIVKGTGTVTHLQERLSTITSNKKTAPIKTRRSVSILGTTDIYTEEGSLLPFENACIGDKAKHI